jgi:hypothetical protein
VPRQTLYKPPHPQIESWPPERLEPGLLSDEPARVVFQAGCLSIAEALAPLGFKYAKSKQRCSRQAGHFHEEVSFQSSHYNVSGRHVQLWLHATVASPALQAWRQKRLPNELASAHVAGGMVHLLGTQYALVQWELADPRDRRQTIEDALAFIRSEVLPYFARINDTAGLISLLAEQAIPAFDLVPSVEFAYCFGGKDQAQAVLDRFLRDRPDLEPGIASEAANPSPSTLLRPGSYVQQVVYLKHIHGLA